MAIILVNLTFTDAELRKEIVSVSSGVELVESLAFTLRVASLSHKEYEAMQPLIEGDLECDKTPTQRLVTLMAEEQRIRPATSDLDYNCEPNHCRQCLVDPFHQLFPETARWCLSALKNLTRPSKDTSAANSLIKTGIFSLILRFITTAGAADRAFRQGSNSSSETPTPADPLDDFCNAPYGWDSNSMQDSALFIIMNLSACQTVRDFVIEAGTVSVLSYITDYNAFKFDDKHILNSDEIKQQDFQCMKAVSAKFFGPCHCKANEISLTNRF